MKALKMFPRTGSSHQAAAGEGGVIPVDGTRNACRSREGQTRSGPLVRIKLGVGLA